MSRVRVGTRGSRLALAQAREIAVRLKEGAPGLRVELVEIETSGDRAHDVALGPSLGHSFFTKEIEEALLDRRIDVAVHSCKDLATAMHPDLVLAAVPPRKDPRDALVTRGPRLADLPPGARVGTSSPRRRAFLLRMRPDLVVVDQRGNVPTRVRAVDEGRIDASVLAVAGLSRLSMTGRIAQVFEPEAMLPAAAQGALALQVRADDAAALQVAALVDDAASRAEVLAERACLRHMEAGCQAPLGALARCDDGFVTLRATLLDGGELLTARSCGSTQDAEAVGTEVAASLLGQLGLETLRGSGLGRDARATSRQGAERA